MKPTLTLTTCVIAISFCSLAARAQQANIPTPASVQTTATHTPPPPATVTGTGLANYIPEWTGSSTLGNSVLFQTGGKIGVNTLIPAVQLDVSGRINSSKSYQIGLRDVLCAPKPTPRPSVPGAMSTSRKPIW